MRSILRVWFEKLFLLELIIKKMVNRREKVTKLTKPHEEISVKLKERLDLGKELLVEIENTTDINKIDDLEHKVKKWRDYIVTYLDNSSTNNDLSFEFWANVGKGAIFGTETPFTRLKDLKDDMPEYLRRLESIYERIEIIELDDHVAQDTEVKNVQKSMINKIFIGHGHAKYWMDLRDFLSTKLNLESVEFNSVSTAGVSTTERLTDLLNECNFAFLIMSAENKQLDGSLKARDNVIHEVGLFQGKLGMKKAIIILEEGCERFSNIEGLTYIPFYNQDLSTCYEKIRDVLQREELI